MLLAIDNQVVQDATNYTHDSGQLLAFRRKLIALLQELAVVNRE